VGVLRDQSEATYRAQRRRAESTAATQKYVSAEHGALGGTRTPNRLLRRQMLYPLSYEGMLTPVIPNPLISRKRALSHLRRLRRRQPQHLRAGRVNKTLMH
jgi:hypothetical protein